MLDQDQHLARILQLAAHYAGDDRSKRRSTAIDYLLEIGELLSEQGKDPVILAPLLDLIPFVADTEGRLPFEERRGVFTPTSDAVLARVVATIEVLQECGQRLEGAAQHVSRQMMRTGVAPPTEGGDPRGWKRILLWRERLLHIRHDHPGWDAYAAFKAEVASMPRQRVVAWALDGKLWDLRERAKVAQPMHTRATGQAD